MEVSIIGKTRFQTTKLKSILDASDSGKWGTDPIINAIRVVRSTNFNDTGYLDLSDVAFRQLTDEEYKQTKLNENDIVIERSGGSANQPVGRVSFITKEIGEVGFGYSNFIQRITFRRKYFAKYYFYCLYYLHNAGLTQAMQTQTNGIRNLEYRYFLNICLPKPHFHEQKAIANYLSKVDQAIDAIKNTIYKLENLKTALMQNLLSGKMKPDGTWRQDDEFWHHDKFGKVPVGWEVRNLGDSHVAIIDPIYEYEVGLEFPFLEMAAVQNNYKGIIEYSTLKIDKRNSGLACFKTGDILYAKITPCVENGKITIINDFNGVGFGSTEFTVISPSNNIENYLLFLLLTDHKIHQKAISLMEGTTGRQRIPKKVFKKNLTIAYPKDKKDQKEIVDIFVNIEKNISLKTKKIDSLQNLKKSLMQNLLTGKIRIPDYIINQIISNE